MLKIKNSGACAIYAGCLLFAFACVFYLINAFIYKYPGNTYLPFFTPHVFITLLLTYMGSCLQFGRNTHVSNILKEVIYFYLTLLVITIATNVIQYTPFKPIDLKIVYFEQYMNISLKDMMDWSFSYPTLILILRHVYNSLVQQIIFIPLLVIITLRFEIIHKYYFLLLISATIGFVFYYFFPTTAPASVIDSPHFSLSQKSTGIKFNEIHNYINPTTIDGGMIALPSFHVIWAWFSVYILKEWKIAFTIMAIFNLVLVAACVLLGWHYTTDVIGSIIVIVLSHYCYHLCNNKVIKRRLIQAKSVATR